MRTPFPRRARRGGFTLLELMIVLMILGILMGYFVVSGSRLFRGAAVRDTEVRIRTLENLLESYRQIQGDYPADRLPAGATANELNGNAEALFLAFYAPDYRGDRPRQEWLGNTDGDATTKSLTILPSRELFEVLDAWGNPIVYFDHRGYERAATVLAGPQDEEPFQQEVRARRDERTGLWHENERFQLLSAGEDGLFGTEDDVANFGGG